MINKNLIVHFGVTGQKFGNRLKRTPGMPFDKEFTRCLLDRLCLGDEIVLNLKNCPPKRIMPTPNAYYYDSGKVVDGFPKVIINLHMISFDEMLILLYICNKDYEAERLKYWHFVPVKYFIEISGLKELTKLLNLGIVTINTFTGWENDAYKNNKGEKMNKVEMHKDICKELTDLYEQKNSDYGNSFADLRKEYPNSVCLRLTDKLNRLKSLYDNNETHKIAESLEDTLKDIANYAIMELIERGYQPEKEPEYKNRLRIEYNGDEGDLYFEFWDKNGKKTEDEWFSICDDHPWNEKVFELAKDINKFLENMYWDEDEDECYIDPGPLSHEALQIARDLLYYEHSLFYDFSEFENRGAADLLNP